LRFFFFSIDVFFQGGCRAFPFSCRVPFCSKSTSFFAEDLNVLPLLPSGRFFFKLIQSFFSGYAPSPLRRKGQRPVMSFSSFLRFSLVANGPFFFLFPAGRFPRVSTTFFFRACMGPRFFLCSLPVPSFVYRTAFPPKSSSPFLCKGQCFVVWVGPSLSPQSGPFSLGRGIVSGSRSVSSSFPHPPDTSIPPPSRIELPERDCPFSGNLLSPRVPIPPTTSFDVDDDASCSLLVVLGFPPPFEAGKVPSPGRAW